MTRTSTERVILEVDNPEATLNRMIDGKWMGKYNIFDPTKVKYVERTDFLKGLVGQIDQGDTIDSHIVDTYTERQYRLTATEYDLFDLAKTYYKYRNKGARLPKFSRWVTGMFAGNKELANLVAAEGQKAAARKIMVSTDVVDILRCADTPHFRSCFKKGDPSYKMFDYEKVPVRIAEETPGIAIAYVDDENGFMMGRHWLHHARVKSTGEDILVLTQSTYGCLEGANLARLLATRGIKVGLGSYYGKSTARTRKDAVAIEYVGCFTKELHHDCATWLTPSYTTLVQPAF